MGRGDKKTKKGKISMGSFGNSRPRKSIQAVQTGNAASLPNNAEKKPAAPAKKK